MEAIESAKKVIQNYGIDYNKCKEVTDLSKGIEVTLKSDKKIVISIKPKLYMNECQLASNITFFITINKTVFNSIVVYSNGQKEQKELIEFMSYLNTLIVIEANERKKNLFNELLNIINPQA